MRKGHSADHGGDVDGKGDTSLSSLRWRHALLVGAASGASGLLTGLCGVPGPPMMLLLTFGVSAEPLAWRATSASANLVAGALQLYLFMCVHGQFAAVDALAYGGMVVGGLMGLALGNRLASRVDGPALQRAMALFLATGAASMVTTPLAPALQLAATLGAAAAAGVALAREARGNRHISSGGAPASTPAEAPTRGKESFTDLEMAHMTQMSDSCQLADLDAAEGSRQELLPRALPAEAMESGTCGNGDDAQGGGQVPRDTNEAIFSPLISGSAGAR